MAYNESRSFSLLLCYLFSFNSTSVLSAESQVGDGHIIQVDVEVLRSLCQDASDVSADNLEKLKR